MLARLAPTLPVPPDRAFAQRFDQPDRPAPADARPGTARAPGRRARRAARGARRAASRRCSRIASWSAAARRWARRYAAEDGAALAGPAPDHRGRRPGAGQRRGRPAGSHPEVAPGQGRQARAAGARRCRGCRRGVRRRTCAAAWRRARPRCASTCAPTRGPPAARSPREVRELVVEAGGAVVDEELAEARSLFPQPDVAAFLDDAARRRRGRRSSTSSTTASPRWSASPARLARYRVNVVADRSGEQGAPVVEERFPCAAEPAGSIDRVQEGPMRLPRRRVDHPRRQPAAADGGFLVVQAAGPALGAGRLGGAEAHARAPACWRSAAPAPGRSGCRARSSPTACRSTSRSCWSASGWAHDAL